MASTDGLNSHLDTNRLSILMLILKATKGRNFQKTNFDFNKKGNSINISK